VGSFLPGKAAQFSFLASTPEFLGLVSIALPVKFWKSVIGLVLDFEGIEGTLALTWLT